MRKDWADWQEMWAEDEYEELQQRAIQEAFAFDAPLQRKKQKRVAVAEGFSLHADTAVHANDRQGLERLCRYGSRGPIAELSVSRLQMPVRAEVLKEWSPTRFRFRRPWVPA